MSLPQEEMRPSPEELLEKVMREERMQKRGRMKVFLGFAAGVGKTYEMLNEAGRRRLRGQDVVIGYIETHKRKGTEEQLGELEIIPRKKISYRGTTLEEMDTEAIVARRPQWVLVDELAHTNAPGSEREKRWQDVEAILEEGINVLTTMNVQHLESLNDTIKDITGIQVRETVPDRVVHEASEMKMVDITPRSLIHRLERGDIYSADKVQQALQNWFREGNLNALREIALREVAQEADEAVEAYRKECHVTEAWATHDRVLVCISPDRPSLRLLRRGWRMSQRLHAEITAIYVESSEMTTERKEILSADFALADRLGVPIVTLQGDVAREIIRFTRERQITQLVIGHSNRPRWQQFFKESIVDKLTRELRTIDILIVAAPDSQL